MDGTDTRDPEGEYADDPTEGLVRPDRAMPPPPLLPPPPPPPSSAAAAGSHHGPGALRRAATAMFAAVVLVAGGYGVRAVTTHGQAAASSTVTADASSNATTSTTSVSALAATAERSIVRITSRITVQGSFLQATQTAELVGTGFVIGSDGLILTNAHVVEHAQSITVTMANGGAYQATVVRSDQAGDLAELKIDATGLPVLRLDTSSAVVGESVVAIGYALGLEGDPTVTTGIVSSTDRTIQVQDDVAGVVRTYAHILQISAPINSGNSGGPVLDASGEVIAIATAGASGAQDVGFAIPIAQATSLIAGA